MAAVAAGMTRTIFEKDRLDGGLEELKIESILPRGCTGFHSTGWRRGGGTANPLRKQPPFWVALRLPELAAGMRGVTAGCLRQWMQQQAAFERVTRGNQLLDE